MAVLGFARLLIDRQSLDPTARRPYPPPARDDREGLTARIDMSVPAESVRNRGLSATKGAGTSRRRAAGYMYWSASCAGAVGGSAAEVGGSPPR